MSPLITTAESSVVTVWRCSCSHQSASSRSYLHVVVHNGLVDRVLTFAVKLCGVFMRVCWAGRDRFVLWRWWRFFLNIRNGEYLWIVIAVLDNRAIVMRSQCDWDFVVQCVHIVSCDVYAVHSGRCVCVFVLVWASVQSVKWVADLTWHSVYYCFVPVLCWAQLFSLTWNTFTFASVLLFTFITRHNWK